MAKSDNHKKRFFDGSTTIMMTIAIAVLIGVVFLIVTKPSAANVTTKLYVIVNTDEQTAAEVRATIQVFSGEDELYQKAISGTSKEFIGILEKGDYRIQASITTEGLAYSLVTDDFFTVDANSKEETVRSFNFRRN